MIYTCLRIYILMWNNSPSWLKQAGRATGFHAFMLKWLTSYAQAPLHPSEIAMARELGRSLTQGAVAADVGANFGVLTEIMARSAGSQGRIIAFEAHPDNAEVLRARCRWLALMEGNAPVEVRNVAVNDGSKAEVLLHAGRRHSANEWNITGHDVTGRPTEGVMRIPAESLDASLGDHPKPVKLIKIDVEGAEDQVFAGMMALVKRHRPVLLIEFHNERTWAKRKLLVDIGYRFFDLDGQEVTNSAQCISHVKGVPGPA
jgi:FkbM family methyltransferase